MRRAFTVESGETVTHTGAKHRQGSPGQESRRSACARRKRTDGALAVLGVILSAWLVACTNSVAAPPQQAHSPAHAVAAPRGLPAAEAGLMPWRLAAPVSREVAVAGPRGKLIVLGGLTDGGDQ